MSSVEDKKNVKVRDGDEMEEEESVESGEEMTREELYEAFVDCARYNDIGTLIAAIAEDPSLVNEAHDRHGNTALHMAAANGYVDVIRVLLGRKEKEPFNGDMSKFQMFLDATNESGNTAVHWAAQNNKAGCIKVLCEAGARADIKNEAGKTPLNEANMRVYEECIFEILKNIPEETIQKEQKERADQIPVSEDDDKDDGNVDLEEMEDKKEME